MTESNADGQLVDFIARSGLRHAAKKLKNGQATTVAFIGGSVTAGAGASDEESTSYRALTCNYLQQRFPHVSFQFINAAIGGTDSAYGAFRFEEHVLKRGTVDLLFIEFAVNDPGDRMRSIRAMEGIVRQAKRSNPQVDICLLYMASKNGVEQYIAEETVNVNIIHHEEAAGFYQLASVNIAADITERIKRGHISWEDISGDAVHPNDYGYALYAGIIQRFLEKSLSLHDEMLAVTVPLTPPMDPLCYERARLADPAAAEVQSGWHFLRGWRTDQVCNWTPPADIFIGQTPDDSFRIHFTGSAFGISILTGMDTGSITVSIDGGEWRTVDPFDYHSELFYRPKIILFTDELHSAAHQADVKIAAQKHEKSVGNAIRIVNFLVN